MRFRENGMNASGTINSEDLRMHTFNQREQEDMYHPENIPQSSLALCERDI